MPNRRRMARKDVWREKGCPSGVAPRSHPFVIDKASLVKELHGNGADATAYSDDIAWVSNVRDNDCMHLIQTIAQNAINIVTSWRAKRQYISNGPKCTFSQLGGMSLRNLVFMVDDCRAPHGCGPNHYTRGATLSLGYQEHYHKAKLAQVCLVWIA